MRRTRMSHSLSLEIPSGMNWKLDAPTFNSDWLFKCHNAYRPRSSCTRARDSRPNSPQRLNYVRYWRLRPSALQLWSDRVHGLLYRHLEARLILRSHKGESPDWTSHVGPSGHQGQGAKSREYGPWSPDLRAPSLYDRRSVCSANAWNRGGAQRRRIHQG